MTNDLGIVPREVTKTRRRCSCPRGAPRRRRRRPHAAACRVSRTRRSRRRYERRAARRVRGAEWVPRGRVEAAFARTRAPAVAPRLKKDAETPGARAERTGGGVDGRERTGEWPVGRRRHEGCRTDRRTIERTRKDSHRNALVMERSPLTSVKKMRVYSYSRGRRDLGLKKKSRNPILETVCSCFLRASRLCATRTWRRSACEKVCERMVARSVARARTGVAPAHEPAHRRDRRADTHARLTRASRCARRRAASRDGFPESSRTLFSLAARRWVVPRRRAARPPSRGGRLRAGRPRPTRPAANAYVRVVETIGGRRAGACLGARAATAIARGDRPRPPPEATPRGSTGAPGKKPERVGARDEPIAPPTSPLAPPRRPDPPTRTRALVARRPEPPLGRRTDPRSLLPPPVAACHHVRSAHTRRRPPLRHGIRRPRRPSGGPMVAPAAHARRPRRLPGPGADTIGNRSSRSTTIVRLHTSPNFLHRFYNDASSLTIAGVGHVPETVAPARDQR